MFSERLKLRRLVARFDALKPGERERLIARSVRRERWAVRFRRWKRRAGALVCRLRGHFWLEWPWGETICQRCDLHKPTIPWAKCDGIDHTFYDADGKEVFHETITPPGRPPE